MKELAYKYMCGLLHVALCLGWTAVAVMFFWFLIRAMVRVIGGGP